ncbi:enhancer of split m4 protein [Condylostylus longicornis]|uniref:enhancer of split m4 protein n=1 Tax=Condylostylus longicornis TaxID=2530218 RepID=UPI00244E26C0|nr:enhancer of split m4 protein [Condylostylus longicornis]
MVLNNNRERNKTKTQCEISNEANEKLLALNRRSSISSTSLTTSTYENLSELDYYTNSDYITTIPVHFAKTEYGTYFWTSTPPQSPTTATMVPNYNQQYYTDFIVNQPLWYSTSNQLITTNMLGDRWAQA